MQALLEDLVQEGNIGLIIAVDKFDVDQQVRLSTYAVPWIKSKISRLYYDKVRMVRIPEAVQIKFNRVAKKTRLDPNTPLSKSEEALLNAFKHRPDEDSWISANPTYLGSLDTDEPLGLWSENTDLENTLAELDVQKYFRGTKNITQKHVEVVCLRLGLYSPPLGFVDIGARLGITRRAAESMYARALNELLKTVKRFGEPTP
jgi:RNA polymerase sigma factor (sigma-70 family)